MRRTLLVVVAACLAVFSTTALAYYLYGRPASVRVAVARGSVDQQLMQEAIRIMQRDRDWLRFRLVLVNDAAAGARALDAGNADFAILPSNERLPIFGKTAVIMRQNVIFALAPSGGAVSSFADLRGKTIGLLRGEATSTGHARLLDAILARHNLSTSEIKRIDVDLKDIQRLISEKKIEALFVDGVAGDGPAADAVNAVARAGNGEPTFIPAGHANALAQHSSAFEQITISAGTFGGAKPRPAQDVETIAVSVRLFASTSLRDGLVGSVTRIMFALKPRLAAAFPLALRIQAPSTSKDASLPTHPGAAAYLDGEEESFFDRFSELFYLGAMILSIIGSATAAIASRLGSGRRHQYQSIVTRLTEMLAAVREAPSESALRLLQQEADKHFSDFMAAAVAGHHDDQKISTLGLALDQVHMAVRDRRFHLEATTPPTRPSAARPGPRSLREAS